MNQPAPPFFKSLYAIYLQINFHKGNMHKTLCSLKHFLLHYKRHETKSRCICRQDASFRPFSAV